MPLTRSLSLHEYPPIFFRFPKIVFFIHCWNNLLLQRNWAVNHQLKSLLPNLPAQSIIVDAGCGDGQHIFPFFKKYKHLHFWGFDKNHNNIAFCKKYSGAVSGRDRLRFFHQHLEGLALENEANLLLCTGTLQYIKEDALVLKNFYRALRPGCNLLLYTPVNGKSVLPFYLYFFEKLGHYEKSQERKRIYAASEIIGKLGAAGFRIVKQKPTYGTLGIAAHEFYSLLLMGLGNAAWWWSWIFLLLLFLWLPFMLVFNGIDFIFPKKIGNGILIMAKKPS
ncbi:MAG: class I SAM-dependent methyltransferase [Saprospiraceae bacterium]